MPRKSQIGPVSKRSRLFQAIRFGLGFEVPQIHLWSSVILTCSQKFQSGAD